MSAIVPVPRAASQDDTEELRFSNDEFRIAVTPHQSEGFRTTASPVARQLGFRDAATMLATIPEAEKGYRLARTPGGDQRVWYITEAGFYRALGQRQAARVKDPAARAAVERFQGWVFREVLPALRRGDLIPAQRRPELIEEDELARAERYVVALKRNKELEAINAELTPKAEAADAFAATPGDFKMGTAAQMMGTGRGRFFDWLRDEKVLQASDGGRPYQRYADWFHVVPSTIDLASGERKVNYTCYVTGEGLHAIYRLLRKRGYPVRKPDVQLALLSADARYGETPQLTS